MAISQNIDDRELGKFREVKDGIATAVTLKGFDADASQQVITLMDTSDSSFIYIGSALPGTNTSDNAWRIQRVDLTTSEIKILYANESQDFAQVWDNRAGLTYG